MTIDAACALIDGKNIVINHIVKYVHNNQKRDWHIVDNYLKGYLEGANVFLISDSITEFVTSESANWFTKLGEIIYELYNSSFKDRDVKWFKTTFNELV